MIEFSPRMVTGRPIGTKVPDVVIIGEGPTGLAACMVLAEHGVETTVLEKDAAPVPETGAAGRESWERDGVSQFRGSHTMLARGFRELDSFASRLIRHLEPHGGHEWTGLERPGRRRASSGSFAAGLEELLVA